MSRDFDEALAHARDRRRALVSTIEDARARFSPPQLAEDVLNLIDPELSLLHRARARIQNNRLLTLAVLAGVGWLVGAPRQNDGEPLGADHAGTSSPRANLKEKKNDSGQIHGEHWPGAGAGRKEEQRTQERAEEAVLARHNRQAQQGGGIPPVEREPQRPIGKQRQDAEQQPRAEQQPEIRQRF